MRRTAVSVAVLGFFVLAAIGAASGVPPFVCAWRAAAGAAVLFILVTVGGRVVIGMVVDAAMRQAGPPQSAKDRAREHGR